MCPSAHSNLRKTMQPTHFQLTEANLRKHSSASIQSTSTCDSEAQPTWATLADPYEHLYDDLDESDDDEDVATRRTNVALRRAASLQALKAYGGCFASGFLAMQDPLPGIPRKWSCADIENLDVQKLASEMAAVDLTTSTAAITTAATSTVVDKSSSAYSPCKQAGRPRPDSDTLSQVCIHEVKPCRRWSWKNLAKRRRSEAN